MMEHDMAGKSVKDPFNPQDFLAKVGAGKTISRYQKDQIIFSQGEVAVDILRSKRPGQGRRPVGSGQGGGRRDFGSRPVLRRGESEQSFIADRDDDRDRGMPALRNREAHNDSGTAR